jgi:hypothetical protein
MLATVAWPAYYVFLLVDLNNGRCEPDHRSEQSAESLCPIQPLLQEHVIVSLVCDCYSRGCYVELGSFGTADMDDRCKGSQQLAVQRLFPVGLDVPQCKAR